MLKNTKKKIIIIDKKSNINQKSIDIDDINICNLDNNIFEKKIKLNRGKGDLLKYAGWKLDEFVITLLGWKNGTAGNENKTDLPPPEDNDLYFGDIVFIKTKDNLIENFTIDDHNYFYDNAFAGFESLGSSDSDESESDNEEDDYDSDDSFIDDSEQDINIKNTHEDYSPNINSIDEDNKTSTSSSSSESLLSLDNELNNLK